VICTAQGKYHNLGEIIASLHPKTPDEKQLVSESGNRDFLSWQGTEGCAEAYAAQTSPKFDAARAEKHPLRMEAI